MAKFLLAENSTPPETPPSGVLAFYAKNDSKLYTKDDSGSEHAVGGSGSTSAANLLINGSFAIWQRGTSQAGVGEPAYCTDRWYVLAESAAINAARTDGSSQRYAARLTQPGASAQRLGLAHIIEGANCRHLRGQKATLSGRARLSASGNARFAILSWIGSEDGDAATDPDPHFASATKDWVNDWTSTSYTAGNFFTSPNLIVEGVSSAACDGSTWSSFNLTTGSTISASMNNLIVFIWSESALVQNATLDLEAVQLEAGESASTFQQRGVSEELALCQRYYERDTGGGYYYFAVLAVPSNTNGFGRFGYAIKRTTPAFDKSALSTFVVFDSIGDIYSPTSITFDNTDVRGSRVWAVESHLARPQASALLCNNTTAYVEIDAEL